MSTTSNQYGNTDNDNLNQQKPGTQQPGYAKQAYDGAATLASSAANYLSGAAGSTGTGYGNQSTNTNTHNRVGGVGDLGTDSANDVTRLPEERANPDPFSNQGARSDNFGSTGQTTGFGGQDNMDQYSSNKTSGFGSTRRDTSSNDNNDPMSTAPGTTGFSGQDNTDQYSSNKTQGYGSTQRDTSFNNNDDPMSSAPGATSDTYDQSSKSWDRSGEAAIAGTAADVTQRGHSGGMTGSNHDTDHGLGMPHKSEYADRGGRDETAIGKSTGYGSTSDNAYDSNRTTSDRYGQTGSTTTGRDDFDNNRDMTSSGYDRDTTATSGVTRNNDSDFNRNTDTSDSNRNNDSYDDNNNTSSSTGGPTKMDKIKGSLTVMKGKIARDPEAIEQGQRLKATGQRINVESEIREGKFDDVLHKSDRFNQNNDNDN